MCLAIPGRVVEIDDSGFLRMAKVDFGGIVREVCLAYVPEAQVGDYVIVHTGFAISRLDEAEALETLRLLSEIGLVETPEGGP
ncbi:MAG: HypC/HybG/HupF family hydrogenase formation chaperone [Chloroflexia bacterium]